MFFFKNKLFYGIISLGKLQNTPNVEIESDKKISLVKITFTLLNLTLTFKFGDSRILLADGKPLADSIHEYKDLCNQRGLNMLDALDSAISIDQLMDPNFNDDLFKKINYVDSNCSAWTSIENILTLSLYFPN